MRVGRRHGHARSLGAEVTSAFRVMIAAMLSIILLTTCAMVWLLAINERRIDDLGRAVTSIEASHVATIDAETSLRAYLFAQQNRFLTPYVNARPVLNDAMLVLDRIDFEGSLARDADLFEETQSAWWNQWASKAFVVALGDPTPAEVTAFLDEGRTLFDEYRAAEQAFAANTRAELERVTQNQSTVLAMLLTFLAVVATVVAVITIRRRRRLRRRVVQPIVQLRGTVDAVAAGDLRGPPPVEAPPELVALRDGLARMTESLAAERQAALDRQARTDEMASRLREVVTFAHDLSGSLSLHHALAAVGDAVHATADADGVRVWLVEADEEQLRLGYDTAVGSDGRRATELRPIGEGLLGRAVRATQPLLEREGGGSRSAWPMVVGARVTGVVEVVDPRRPSSPELFGHVESLIGFASAAIEAARLHEQTERLSTQDGLTGLANRRRFDEDLERETEGALRHARRIALVMLDLDDFKLVNDTFGHQRGDHVLTEAAAVLRREARSADHVYRYGGEEFGVLVHESDAAGAALVAERMRAAVETHFARAGVTQTVSCGVASVPEHAVSAEELVAAADSALYAAKQDGRNRVVIAGVGAPDVLTGDVPARR
jgi:diguanylate cyclase (GGDEF)-like protein